MDTSYLAHLERVRDLYEKRVHHPEIEIGLPLGPEESIAYFSMEFGLHESLPLFAGGLGILAGDHLKAASNMGLPLVGVGLLYRQGYFRQYLNHEGWQQEAYPETDFFSLPIQRMRDASGNEVRVVVRGADGPIQAIVWKIQVGRIPLYLLDTNILENPPEHREITARLYAAETKIRLVQEVLLGIGGMRALQALGVKAKIVHMNEGHCAFAGLERLAQIVDEYQVDLKTAMQIVPRTTIFTTHTPVAAGHDEFPADMVRPYLKPLADRLGVAETELLAWGQPFGADNNGPLSMFILGVRLAPAATGSASCTAASPGACGPMSGRDGRSKRFPSRTSPTGFTWPPSSPMSSAASSTATSARTGIWAPSGRKTSSASTRSTTKSSGAPTS